MSDFLDRIYLGALNCERVNSDTQKRIFDYALKQNKYDLLEILINHKYFDKALISNIAQVKNIRVLSLYLFSKNRENKEILEILKTEKRKKFLEQCLVVEKNLGAGSYDLVYKNYGKFNIPFLELFIHNNNVPPKLKKLAYVELLELALTELSKKQPIRLNLSYEGDNEDVLHEPLRNLLVNEVKYFKLWSVINYSFSKIMLNDLTKAFQNLIESDLPDKTKLTQGLTVLNKLLKYEKNCPQVCKIVELFNSFLGSNPKLRVGKDPSYNLYLTKSKAYKSKVIIDEVALLHSVVSLVNDDLSYLNALKALNKFENKYESYLIDEFADIVYSLLSKVNPTIENYYLAYDFLPDNPQLEKLVEKISSPKMLGYFIAGALTTAELIELKNSSGFKEILAGFLEMTYKEVGYLDYQLYEEGIISDEILKTFPIEMIKYASLFNNVESTLLTMLEEELLTSEQWDVVESMADDFGGSFKELLEMAKNI